MKVKQKNLRVFHISIDEAEEFIAYFSKNRVILKEFFLLLDGKVTQELSDFLQQEKVCFKDISQCSVRLGSVKQDASLVPDEPQKVQKEEKSEAKEKEHRAPAKMKIYDRPIRSGEEISEESPLTVFGRVNSGAKLFCTQSVSIYGAIDGLVQCDGEFMIFYGLSQRGNIIFNGEIIDKELIKEETLQKLVKKGTLFEIKEVF